MVENTKAPEIRFDGFNEEWEQQKLGAITDIRTGPFGSLLHAEDYVADGVPIVTTEHFKKGFLPDRKNRLPQVSHYDYMRLQSYMLEINDIVFSRVGSVDVNALVTEPQRGWLFSGRVLRARPSEKIVGEYLHYLLETPTVKTDIIGRAVGQTMPSINTEILKETKMTLSALLSEQTAIGNFFRNLDDAIALKKQQHEKTLNIKKAMLEKMFPQKGADVPEIRFEGFTGAWECQRLGEVAEFSKGSGYSKGDLVASGTPIILYGRLYTKYETEIDYVDTYVKMKDKSVISSGGEVIVPSSGETAEDIARASVISNAGVILGGDLNIIKPNAEINPTFLAITISNGFPQKELSKRAQGKSVVYIHNSDLREIVVQLPNLTEQATIATFFRSLDTLIESQRQELEKLQNIKKACLEKMFV